jgi:transposase/transcriptional regulator with XRE-family HTH domain
VYGREIRERILATTLTRPEGTTHWSTRRLAKRVGVSASTVARVWQEGRLKPHRTERFKFSRDPELMAKATDVVGLYLAPPERAMVLSVDEKTQIQRHTHDYKRNGTLSLFAALEVATGTVTNQARERHTGEDFLGFLRLLARTYPRGQIHVVLDNVSTHKTPDVQKWLREHKRFHFHFTPTSASWLNMVERFFRDLSTQRLERGVFRSVPELIAAIKDYVAVHNENPKPFIWTAKAADILQKVIRANQRLSSKQNEALH